MRQFTDLAAFAAFCFKMAAIADRIAYEGLATATQHLHREAHDLYGNKQELQPYLKPETVAQRIREGYTPDDTMLRSGDLQKKLAWDAKGPEAGVGSPDMRAYWHEIGAKPNPPRPLLRIAVDKSRIANKAIILAFCAKAVGMTPKPMSVRGVQGISRVP